MKNGILLTAVLLIFAACNKNDLPPVNNPDPYLNYYAGTYAGVFKETRNGADSANGVFKIDTSFNFVLELIDAGREKKGMYSPSDSSLLFMPASRYTISINKGPLVINSVPIDSNGSFAFEDHNRNIFGHFKEDSVIITSDAINGTYDSIYFSGSWFVIQKLSFRGKKTL